MIKEFTQFYIAINLIKFKERWKWQKHQKIVLEKLNALDKRTKNTDKVIE